MSSTQRHAQTYNLYGYSDSEYYNTQDYSALNGQAHDYEYEQCLALTAEDVQQLTQAIYDFNDQVQQYYQTRLAFLQDLLRQVQELHNVQWEPEALRYRLLELQSTIDAYIAEAEQDLFGSTNELEEHGPHLQGTTTTSNFNWRRIQVPAKYYQRKLKKHVPARYYHNALPAMRPNSMPGMPITASDTLYASLKSSQPALFAQLEAMVPNWNQNQATVVQLKKSAPILTAEVETVLSSLSKQIAMTQPLLATKWDSALTQTMQMQAFVAAELSQLMVDAKNLIAWYLVDMGACGDVTGTCDIL